MVSDFGHFIICLEELSQKIVPKTINHVEKIVDVTKNF